MSVRFEYLYRDGSNFKSFAWVAFAGVVTDTMVTRLRAALESGEWFVAHQVRVPETFIDDGEVTADDHCWHEFSQVEETEDPPDDRFGRTFDEFVGEVEEEARAGWEVFDRWERERGFLGGPSDREGGSARRGKTGGEVVARPNATDVVRRLLDAMPDGASFEDILYKVYVLRSIDRGTVAAERDDFISDDQIGSRIARTKKKRKAVP